MSYSLEVLPGEPILIGTMYDTYRIKEDYAPYIAKFTSILESQSRPVYYVNDLRNLRIEIFQDFLTTINQSVRGEDAIVNHPNLIATIMVSNAEFLKLSMKGLDSEIFGNLSIPVFETLEEALDYVRELI